ncbi:VOC family protein [Leptolyngbya sp. 15MV]|nr:VOC family protein [Leptolyngbya sp. 15MV]
MDGEPVLDIAHLGHVELLTPKPAESLAFFRDVMGMTVSGQRGTSVFLRGWDDCDRAQRRYRRLARQPHGVRHRPRGALPRAQRPRVGR